ncbi:putative HTH-type transcriptional regulator TtgW [Pseudovibrio sp. Ad46]|uniref:TetR/AcrR family transcriptional regulator n=1 Tax=unclassified Pseudovibrio TaxID=2627060 RepID=UPI0007AE7F28|nr:MULTISPECIES: TetR/AcrR family transcriptional regulator [unclassified Pseudovibrio]KZK75598.1 putative HTH-type transcriptional regulator TtgW [Pseudovibrio sp. Ad46]KZK99701.1 putative HTH-type transcriptional regulator TtgW [Pseudovibrio sp. Ad5]
MPDLHDQESTKVDARQMRADHLRGTRRSLIVNAARDVFTKEGLDGASMRSIARTAGCTTGAIYPYFHGKEELYCAVLQEALEQLHFNVTEAIKTCLSIEEKAQAGVLAFFDFYNERPDDLALGLYVFSGLKRVGLGRELDGVLNVQVSRVIALIEGCARAGGRSPEWPAGAIAHCMGLLVMGHTGRLSHWDYDGRYLLEQFLRR